MGEAANGYFTLNTGASIPCIGLGTWQSSPSVVADAIVAAIKAGYRHIDCARFYQNEKEIGVALKKVFKDGLVKRDDLFITSKLWCSDHAPEDVPRALELTLKDLQLEYIDLYLIHWPFRVKKGEDVVPDNFIPPDIPSTWRAMEKLQNSGKARAIGVSNFSTKKLDDLLATTCTIPAVNQVECHPAWQQVKLHSYCRSKGIHLSGYAPLTAPGRKWMYGNVLENPIVQMLAETLNKTPAQVVLRWGIQMGHSVLPKSCSEARIKENINIFNWSIPQHLIGKFGEVEQVRHVTGQFAVHEKSIYKTLEQLWDDDN